LVSPEIKPPSEEIDVENKIPTTQPSIETQDTSVQSEKEYTNEQKTDCDQTVQDLVFQEKKNFWSN
jgi:hypothetical protein